MKRKFYNPGVYALTCEDNTVKYVGVGKDWEQRGKSHWKVFLSLGKAINKLVKNWFEELKLLGKEPKLILIERCSNFELEKERERFWIKTYRAYEEATCNITAGGNFVPEYLQSEGGIIGGTHTQKKWRGSQEQRDWCRRGAINQSYEDKVKASKLGAIARGKQLSSPEERQHQIEAGRFRGKFLSSPEGKEHQSFAGKRGTHKYWHVRRGILKPGCALCEELKCCQS